MIILIGISRFFCCENLIMAFAENYTITFLLDGVINERREIMMKDNEMLVFEKGEAGFRLFLNTLKMQKETDIWRKCDTREICVHPLHNNPMDIPVLRKEMNIPCSDELLEECMSQKGLLLEFPYEDSGTIFVPIRRTAYSSICGRGHVSGTALGKMNNEDFCTVINICLHQWNDSSLILYRDEKISAVHSGDNADYSILVMHDLVSTLKKGLENLGEGKGGYEFTSAFLDHSMCVANFILKDRGIMETYIPFLKKMGYEKTNKFYPLVRFSSSDVALCGARITPCLTDGRIEVQVGNPLTVNHKNCATVMDFANNVNGIYALFRACAEQLEQLENIVLKYPEDCFVHVCKKIKVANRYLTDAYDEFQMVRGEKTTALELYMAICEIIPLMKNENEPENKIFKEQEKIARILTLNIKSYDKPQKL